MTPILYILHSGNLYGTERMALATMTGLQQQGRGHLLAPAGPVHAEAARLGITSHVFNSTPRLVQLLFTLLRQQRKLAVIATGVSHSLVAHALSTLLRCPLRHLHVVHGGTDEKLSYGRKSLLTRLPVTLVAVSDFVASRLVAHGCDPKRIRVIENFLTATTADAAEDSRRGMRSIRKVALVSRLDPIKRVGLLLDALAHQPLLGLLQFDVFGEGSEAEVLKQRAAAFPNVHLQGFQPDAAARLADYDLLLHTCAEEPFGLALLEAMASGIPVLTPNAGGAGALVADGDTGFHFPANCSKGLARRLVDVCSMASGPLDNVVAAASQQLATRFSPLRGLVDYAALLREPQHV